VPKRSASKPVTRSWSKTLWQVSRRAGAGHFGLVVGVNHHDYADQLLAHGADVVVADLAELLDKNVAMG